MFDRFICYFIISWCFLVLSLSMVFSISLLVIAYLCVR